MNRLVLLIVAMLVLGPQSTRAETRLVSHAVGGSWIHDADAGMSDLHLGYTWTTDFVQGKLLVGQSLRHQFGLLVGPSGVLFKALAAETTNFRGGKVSLGVGLLTRLFSDLINNDSLVESFTAPSLFLMSLEFETVGKTARFISLDWMQINPLFLPDQRYNLILTLGIKFRSRAFL